MPFTPGPSSSASPGNRSTRTGKMGGWRNRARAAFTLVEMIVVMAIIVILLGVLGPVIRGILTNRNVSDGVDAISGYLAYARTQAVTQNTYVVVGFYQASGSDDLRMGSIVSVNGTFNPANFSPANVISPVTSFPALGKVIHVSNVTLVPEGSLSTQLQTKLSAAGAVPDGNTIAECSASPDYPTNSINNPSYFSFPVGSLTFSYTVIAFSPQGEALFFTQAPSSGVTNTLPFYSQLFIGLRATRGGAVVSSDVNSAAITIDGGSGDIKNYRL